MFFNSNLIKKINYNIVMNIINSKLFNKLYKILSINLSKMGLPSKENKILKLFFNEGTKQWHFKDIVKQAKISEDRANYWLKKLVKEKIIVHKKPKNKMPYFIANFESSEYKTKKKIYALTELNNSGLINYLESLKAKTIVLFGSFSRADWYTNSDIDLLIIGNDKIETIKFQSKLKREIEIHNFKNKKELKKIRTGLLHNVINGYFIKGKVQDLVEVKI